MNAVPVLLHERATPSLRCLWLSRDMPFPQDAGDRIYSANLAAALERANVKVCFVGYHSGAATVPDDWVSRWIAVPGVKRDARLALLSRYPRIAALHATRAYRRLLRQLLAEPWDVIVLDGYGSGWALRPCLARRAANASTPRLVYVSHNHEESLWRAMTHATRRISLQRLAVWQNYHKARVLERALVRHADLITTITGEDAQVYARQQLAEVTVADQLVLTPGYSGAVRAHRHMTAAIPRRVVMVGSYRWLIKQQNLRQLVTLADPLFAEHGISLDVVGDVPDELLRELKSQVRATHFHGFVSNLATYFDQARLALVPEVVGGGFKLKFLDYVFARVPVVTLTSASAGVPPTLAQCLICCIDLPDLVRQVVRHIDDLATLNELQEQAYQRAMPLFNWDDRGRELARAMRRRSKP